MSKKNYLIDEIFEPEVYINEIEHQLMIMQTFLDKLRRSVVLIELSDAIADDPQLAEDISNNPVEFLEHEMVMMEIEHHSHCNQHHLKPTNLLEDLLVKTSYELHSNELHKLFPMAEPEVLGKEVEDEE